ncbi:MAG TPA: adenylate/guanylate cyclase domain-containing protein [Chthonomonadaceae bacterium]|nr:adenylate/guanylate cyclase domain-containing protein [Chthonomonadaceae bacterium]
MDVANDLENMSRLLLEDVCTDLMRFLHSRGDATQFGAVRIDREWALGPTGNYADIRVEPCNAPPYFVEVKHGYSAQAILNLIKRKYGNPYGLTDEDRVVLVVQPSEHSDWPSLETSLRNALDPTLALEVWDEERLHHEMAECFGQGIPTFTCHDYIGIRECIDQGKERLAFGTKPAVRYSESILRQNLLWHFGTWRLRELRHMRGNPLPTELVPPGLYENVVVVMADLCGFSAFMHDTYEDAVVRQILTSFYAKSRYQVINGGGMLVQFVGDSVVALFGIPDQRPGYVEEAMRTALRLLDIGASVSHNWQRRIDHVQPHRGAHIGIAMGRVHVVTMRPLDHARLATIGDSLDISARLLKLAGPGEIVVSNVMRYALQGADYDFSAMEPTEVRSLGLLQPWRLARAAREEHGTVGE